MSEITQSAIRMFVNVIIVVIIIVTFWLPNSAFADTVVMTVHWTRTPDGGSDVTEEERAQEKGAERTGTWEGGTAKVVSALSGSRLTRPVHRPSIPVGTKKEFMEALSRLKEGDTLYINAHGNPNGLGIGTHGPLLRFEDIGRAMGRNRPKLLMVVIDACALGADKNSFRKTAEAFNTDLVLGWKTYAGTAGHTHAMSGLLRKFYLDGVEIEKGKLPLPVPVMVGKPYIYARNKDYGKTLAQKYLEITNTCPDLSGQWLGTLTAKEALLSGKTNLRDGHKMSILDDVFRIEQKGGDCGLQLKYRGRVFSGECGYNKTKEEWYTKLEAKPTKNGAPSARAKDRRGTTLSGGSISGMDAFGEESLDKKAMTDKRWVDLKMTKMDAEARGLEIDVKVMHHHGELRDDDYFEIGFSGVLHREKKK